MRIALDAMGGDLAPKATVEGAVMAARDLGLDIVLIGERGTVTRELAEHSAANLPIRIEHAAEVVAMDDSPLESILTKTGSSMHAGFEMLKRGEVDAFVSAGNSGAMMTAAIMILGTLPGVDRPAIGTLVPTGNGVALLIDAGANTEVKPLNLVQFAIMGSVYSTRVRHVARPRVGILSNGEEPSKGTDLTRTAAAMLYAMSPMLTYIGYIEGRDINRAKADVIVTDGFTGNVALKTMEGTGAMILGNLRELLSGSLRGRIAYLLLRGRLAAMRRHLDPSEYGGAPLLGVNGISIVAHGSSSPQAIRNAIRAAAGEAQARTLNQEIADLIARSSSAATAKAAGKGFRAMFSRMRDRLQRHRETEKKAASAHDAPYPPRETAPEPAEQDDLAASVATYEPQSPTEMQNEPGPAGTSAIADSHNAVEVEIVPGRFAEPGSKPAAHHDDDAERGGGDSGLKASTNGLISDSRPVDGNHEAPPPNHAGGDGAREPSNNREVNGRSLSAALGSAHGLGLTDVQPSPEQVHPDKGEHS